MSGLEDEVGREGAVVDHDDGVLHSIVLHDQRSDFSGFNSEAADLDVPRQPACDLEVPA
eukprot:CAMPEP_0205927294 /NCGR_PEP_ID=MMETSP1325-20131115/22311_1 /ASSEMBLY_ACC=CAM_ASM_000708 /TAXON_ID=236786 /ORGANISM="Florenciella sp., Strain RCC1007" /LENGTH=58 /DNA_ID=CAMNT_0053296149 /DNA_START=54 /DNA_END=226 /DNA_ORIENTATION=-